MSRRADPNEEPEVLLAHDLGELLTCEGCTAFPCSSTGMRSCSVCRKLRCVVCLAYPQGREPMTCWVCAGRPDPRTIDVSTLFPPPVAVADG